MKKIFWLICFFNLTALLFAQSKIESDFPWVKNVGAHSFPSSQKIYNVEDYGAVGDGVFLNTTAIQKTIDEAEANGGGTITFKPGIYLTGSVFIGNNINFNIPKGTMLLGSQNIDDYQRIDTRVAGIEMKWPAALINIVNKKNAAITGDGVINGKGKIFWDKYWSMRKEYEPKGLRWIVDYDCERPRGILVSDSEDVTIKGVVLYQPGFWSVHVLYSKFVTIDGVIISNNIEGRGPSTDGIDIDSSSQILVQNSIINCNDDNFCLKSGRDSDGLRVNRPCEYIVIRDCVAEHGAGLLTCGSETSGGIRHIVGYNLTGNGTSNGLRFKSTVQRGGTIEDIYMYNIDLKNVAYPIVVDLNWNPAYSTSILPKEYDIQTVPEHWKKLLGKVDIKEGTPKFQDIKFENIKASGAKTCIIAVGIETSTLENFTLTNVHLQGNEAGKIDFSKDWTFKDFKIEAPDKIVVSNSK
jgi:polygalacturonase